MEEHSALFPAHVSDLRQCSAVWPPYSQFSIQTVHFVKTQLSVSSQLTWQSSLSLQVLLVFSDGLDDSLEDLRKAADSLRFKGITGLLWCSRLLLPMAQCIVPPLLLHVTLPLHAHMVFLRRHWESVCFSMWISVHDGLSLADNARNMRGVQRGWNGSGFWSPAPAPGAIQGSPSHWRVQHQRLDPSLSSGGENSFTILLGH